MQAIRCREYRFDPASAPKEGKVDKGTNGVLHV
jgi:hypothetical protein